MHELQDIKFTPAIVPHPGEILTDYLVAAGISAAELASRAGLRSDEIRNICDGNSPITERIAGALQLHLGRRKSFWLNLQARYDASPIARRFPVVRLEEKFDRGDWRLDRQGLESLDALLAFHITAGLEYTAVATRMFRRLVIELMIYRAVDREGKFDEARARIKHIPDEPQPKAQPQPSAAPKDVDDDDCDDGDDGDDDEPAPGDAAPVVSVAIDNLAKSKELRILIERDGNLWLALCVEHDLESQYVTSRSEFGRETPGFALLRFLEDHIHRCESTGRVPFATPRNPKNRAGNVAARFAAARGIEYHTTVMIRGWDLLLTIREGGQTP